jgi:hypothetical protein
MEIRISALLASMVILSACGTDPKAPSDAKFRSVINAELAKSNPYCEELQPGLYSGIPSSPLADALGKRGLLKPNGRNWFMDNEASKSLLPGQKVPPWGLSACVADGAEVAAIVNWTEPANMFGTISTKVKYTIKPTKRAAWITPDLEPLLPKRSDDKPRTMEMVLTAKGWEKATD